MEWSKPKLQADGTKSESVPIFRIPLHTPGGQTITTFARVMDNTGWLFEQICKSGDLIPPEGEEFVITADELESRKFYFRVQHTTYNGTRKWGFKDLLRTTGSGCCELVIESCDPLV